MADALTNNRSLLQPAVGGDAGTWGGLVNTGTFGQLDLVLGNTQSISLSSSNITLSQTQWNNVALALTGTLTQNVTVYLPFSPNSTTVAVGGSFIVENNCTGSFNVTVSTTASGATGVIAPNGVRSFLYSDQTNVWYANDAGAQFTTVSGNPNGQLAGTAATVNNPPHPLAWDYTGGTGGWAPTTTGTSTTTVWAQLAAIGAALPIPEGYLTPVSNTPIITSDSVAATAIYYAPFMGQWAPIHNGSLIIPFQLTSQLQLTLSSSQAASNIYDIFLAYNGGTPVIGTGPSWSAGSSGSVTPGSCARGTGAGGTSLARLQGVWTNAVQISLIFNTGAGNTTITVPVNQGIYLGSIFVDGSAGQVSCYRSYGQSRKFGIWNAYQRTPILIKAGDSTTSWTYAVASWRPSNNNTANSINVCTGLAEEGVDAQFWQKADNNTAGARSQVAIGFNSTASPSGFAGNYESPTIIAGIGEIHARYIVAPLLGINTVTSLEEVTVSGTSTFFGTEANTLLTVTYRG